jgi:RND family efflux transporter MFP subunit
MILSKTLYQEIIAPFFGGGQTMDPAQLPADAASGPQNGPTIKSATPPPEAAAGRRRRLAMEVAWRNAVPRPRGHGLLIAGGTGVLLVGLYVAAMLWYSQLEPESTADVAARGEGMAAVEVTKARPGLPATHLVLPGTTAPWMETSIHARATGYVAQVLVHVGDRVRAGQLLAVIASPEVDAQLAQARATLTQSQANLARDLANEEFASAERERVQRLMGKHAAPQEEYENRIAAAKVASAAVQAAKATIKVNEAGVQRLEALQSFQKIVAPFAGTITARNVDPGALIQADQVGGRELFHLAQVDTLRVLVNVPPAPAPWIGRGQAAVVIAPEHPAQKVPGEVVGTAGTLDGRTHTLLAAVRVPNQDYALLPGMSVEVQFVLKAAKPPVLIAARAFSGAGQDQWVGN